MALLWLFTFAAVGVAFLYRLRKYCAGKKCTCSTRLDDKVIIITGATSGIGREVAHDLAHRGATLILGCRDADKAQEVADEIINESGNTAVRAMHLDLCSLASVRRFVNSFRNGAVEAHLDVLINNAGVFYLPNEKSEDGVESVFAINYLGHFLLTMLLLDNLQSSDSSRVINVSSGAYKWARGLDLGHIEGNGPYSKWTAYCQSKLAQILFTRKLLEHLRGSAVSVFSMDPGSCRTNMYRHFPYLQGMLGMLQAPLRWIVVKTPKDGAQTVIHCAVSRDILYRSGNHFYDCRVQELHPVATDEQSAQRLWDYSIKLAKLQ